MKRILLAFLLLLGPLSTVSATELRPFVSGSYPAIVQAHAGTPFLLVFWSLDCPPCHEELSMLGRLHRERPFDLVVVATDPSHLADKAGEVLEEKGLAGAETWIFAGDFPRRLRHQVDPRWYGELPRSYFFDAEGGRRAVSGRLERTRVQAWLNAAR